ncbi:DUF3923 family protein [Corynebacterium tuberculostearicum]|uniref:DUF3923 family protein n=1 Tax=Corynebacterium tuberculostearicum TaxID=38304 RepID=UPI002647B4F4|nr:DUF3923 family protein [Corynebacterium tuberculostearicum]MDV2433623.1 DUF3923 family protein [Corynebacterium tuberculostearicum]WKE56857.1 DUF3923 family protein [Corynebacterium tuberculostearicum]WKE60421.1 DUF3923 family protein [Corynebacterium tuberculostearicum]
MKLSWALWWTVTLIEVLSFIALSTLLLVRAEDAAGAQQTTELRLLNVVILIFAYLIPFAIQVVWFILNKRAEKKATRRP